MKAASRLNQAMQPNRWPRAMASSHAYEVRPCKDHRGVDLISDALPFGRLWYDGPNAVSNAIGYATFVFARADFVNVHRKP
jgi:hypothetical protein